MAGALDILNVGAGHLSLALDPENPVELERARRMVTDMLRRGYAIFVEVDGKLAPVREFDEKRGVYLVTDVPGSMKAAAPEAEPEAQPEPRALSAVASPAECPRCGRAKHRGRCRKEVPMAKARATAIGRTAGG